MTRAALPAILLVLALAACAPKAPKGVDKGVLDEAISKAVGDPNTCVLIAEAGSGKVVYQYNSVGACRADWPACQGAALRSAHDLVEATAKAPATVAASCPSVDPSRIVAWAAGPAPRSGLVYATVMEGPRAFPGRMVADRVERAFRRSGL